MLALLVASAAPAAAQSLLERSPNMGGGWVSVPGTVQFNFLHRFSNAGTPTRKVASSPTFLLGAGLPWRTMLGVQYATNSDVAPRYPNEWEAFARWGAWSQGSGAPLDVGVQGGWNAAARSADGELLLARSIGAVQLRGAGRVFSHPFDQSGARGALAGGVVVRLGRWVALSGDYGTMLDRPEGAKAAWSAAVQLAIPYSPHTLSLQATTTNTATLEGASVSRDGRRRYGFEFTIPLTLARYVSRSPAPVAGASAPAAAPREPAPADTIPAADTTTRVPVAAPAPAPADTVRADTTAAATGRPVVPAAPRRPPAAAAPRSARVVRAEIRQVAYARPRLAVEAGTTIVWTNRDPMPHSVTADDGSWDSGPIAPGGTWRRTFARPGRYAFHCTPHPFMKGVVEVR